MPIPLFLLDRIKTSAMSGEQVGDAFARLAAVADQRDIDGCAVNLEYVKHGDTLVPGDLIPTVTLSLLRWRDSASSGDRPPAAAEAACEVYTGNNQ